MNSFFFSFKTLIISTLSCCTYNTCTILLNLKDCSESAPEIHVPNGNIVQRTYSPASITYGCIKDFIGYGTIQTINCSNGGKWSLLDYQCEHSKQLF